MLMKISCKFVTTFGFIGAWTFLAAAPFALADKDWDYQCQEGSCRIALESKARAPELAMPGLGLSASATQLKKRIAFAVETGKITGSEANEIKSAADDISAQLATIKASGKGISFEQGLTLGKLIAGLDERLQQKVLAFQPKVDETQALASAVLDVQSLNADLRKRISENLSSGRLQASQARKLRQEAKEISARATSNSSDPEQLQLASRDLKRLNIRLERELSNTAIGYRNPSGSDSGSYLNFPRAF